MELTEMHVVVICRGVNPSADAVRIMNVALSMEGIIAVHIDKKVPITRGPERRLGAE